MSVTGCFEDILCVEDYYPFGMQLIGRAWALANEDYRFGFNGYESTDEILVDDVAIDFGARIYDGRIGKFFSIDIKSTQYPWQSVYAYFSNSPISIVDVKGMGAPTNFDGAHQFSGTKCETGNNKSGNGVTDINFAAHTISMSQTIYYNENDPNLSPKMFEGTDVFHGDNSLARHDLGYFEGDKVNGWQAHPYFIQFMGVTWTVTYSVKYIACKSDEEVKERADNDNTSIPFLFRGGFDVYTAADLWMETYHYYTNVFSHPPDEHTHELGHGFGLVHACDWPIDVSANAYYGDTEAACVGTGGYTFNGSNDCISPEPPGPAMSYAINRSIYTYEVEQTVLPLLRFAIQRAADAKSMKIHYSYGTYSIMEIKH